MDISSETDTSKPIVQTPTFVVYEDDLTAAGHLAAEIERRGRPVETFNDRPALIERARKLPRAVFAIDIDHGHGKEQEGLFAISQLREVETSEQSDFLIAALTSHPEFEGKAAAKGVDAFLVKASTITDALELLARSAAHDLDVVAERGKSLEQELAGREYATLRDVWLEVAFGPSGPFHPAAVGRLRRHIARAMRWPFLSENEQILLGTLDELVRTLEASEDQDPAIVRKVTTGFDYLAGFLVRSTPVIQEWLTDLTTTGADVQLRWLDLKDDEQP